MFMCPCATQKLTTTSLDLDDEFGRMPFHSPLAELFKQMQNIAQERARQISSASAARWPQLFQMKPTNGYEPCSNVRQLLQFKTIQILSIRDFGTGPLQEVFDAADFAIECLNGSFELADSTDQTLS